MKKQEKISVIIPIYNVENFLPRCLDSIINSNYQNLEIILVDDGSTDSCSQICEEYKEKDSRIKVIHKSNGGLSDARNKGIDIATGKYISFVDSDDVVDEDMFSYLLNLLIDNKCDISVCNYTTFSTMEPPQTKTNKLDNPRIYSREEALNILLKGKISHSDYAWNKLYKKELFKNIRYPRGRKMEDIGTTYKLYYKAKNIVIGDSIKYFYYQRKNSILGLNNYEIYKDNLELSIERYNFLKDNKVKINFVQYQKDIINKIIELYKNSKTENQHKYFYDNSYDKIFIKLFDLKMLKGEHLKKIVRYYIYSKRIKKGSAKNVR